MLSPVGYRERPVKASPPQLTIDERTFDLDAFGMDEGGSPDPQAALRFLFQLGYACMTYLYVIQAGGRKANAHFSHTLWIRDCAVAEVEMEDQGAPSHVTIPRISLPLNYTEVTIVDAGGKAGRAFAIREQICSSTSAEDLTMEFRLEDRARL